MEFTKDCEPLSVFKFFELLSSVPHGSGNTKEISDICVNFAKERGLRYHQDGHNNVIIYKNGSAGKEDLPPVIIQGHLDMVCAKDPEDPTDMSAVPIRLKIEDGYLCADKTSLGGDDAIAVAMALAVLDDDSLSHPPIEAVFTTDEETGMFGAAGLDASLLRGRRMLNIDSEEEGVFTAGCSGGLRANCEIPVKREKYGDGLTTFSVTLSGLLGGHSGCDIDKERGSSNILMARSLYEASKRMPLRLISLSGGEFDNVIAGKTTAEVAVSGLDADRFAALVSEYDAIYKHEFASSDPGVSLVCAPCKVKADTVTLPDTAKILKALRILPYGIQNMSMDIKGLVETSLNLGVLRLADGCLKYSFAIRSSVASRKYELLDRVRTVTELAGGSVTTHGEYPGWEFKKDSPLREAALSAYRDVYGGEAQITATHGGLECGLFADKLPGLDCISYGPELHDVHSVRERLGISSVGRVYRLTCRILELLD
ncbi:MAG: aminoacyl-histidine dipeptidase [Clostridia bacterium]|nr:aminoacyl-histidine dipeptidase [Clostridia bacterium]